jgi:hypothetical protein
MIGIYGFDRIERLNQTFDAVNASIGICYKRRMKIIETTNGNLYFVTMMTREQGRQCGYNGEERFSNHKKYVTLARNYLPYNLNYLPK